jgi:hypothetical protein
MIVFYAYSGLKRAVELQSDPPTATLSGCPVSLSSAATTFATRGIRKNVMTDARGALVSILGIEKQYLSV